jgi:acetyl esterase/lipase
MAPLLIVLSTCVWIWGVPSFGSPRISASSIDPFTSRIVRLFTALPLGSLRIGSVYARRFLKSSISQESPELVFETPDNGNGDNNGGSEGKRKPRVETITYPAPASSSSPRSSSSSSEDVSLLFFHGGAMSLCDSGDLLVCQRLLPMISHFAGGARVTMYSVLYSLHQEEEEEEGTGTYLKVHREIEEGYAEVCRLVKSRAGPDGRIAAIMGDSAGGHLSMCLALQLLHRNADHVPALGLISPWLNCFNHGRYAPLLALDAYKDDILNYSWLKRSVANYWGGRCDHSSDNGGSSGSGGDGGTSTDEESVLFASAFARSTREVLNLPPHAVNPWLVKSHDFQRLGSVLCVAGSNEVLVEEIQEFWADIVTSAPAPASAANITGCSSGGSALSLSSEQHNNKRKKNNNKKQQHEEEEKEPHHQHQHQHQQEQQKDRSNPTRELLVVRGEVHAFPLFWRHPLRRFMSPFGLTFLFDKLFPAGSLAPTDTAAAAAAAAAADDDDDDTVLSGTTPASGDDDTASSPRTLGSGAGVWRDVATPSPRANGNSTPRGVMIPPTTPSSGNSKDRVALLASVPASSIDSQKADDVLTRMAHFVAAEHSALAIDSKNKIKKKNNE